MDSKPDRKRLDESELGRIVELARRNSGLSDEDATALAVEEVHQYRLERAKRAAER